MIGRLALLALIAIGLSPGLFWRDDPPPYDQTSGVVAKRIAAGMQRLGPFAVEGVWQLLSENDRFGGYSGLVALSPNRLLSVSDAGRMMTITLEDGAPKQFAMTSFVRETEDSAKNTRDVEAITRDPASGRLWAAYEDSNAIERRSRTLAPERKVRPPEMRGWGKNTGPEAFTRLADGRFLVLSEGSRRMFGAVHPAVLYPDDPTTGVAGLRFSIRMPEGYDPSDMAALPDGRVLILGRKVRLIPPGFRTMVMVADPAGIRRGAEWRGTVLARIDPPFPSDNYEGLAVVPAADGGYPVTLWLISDDNRMQIQRTLLAKLRWDGSSM
ncbi:esterase-like activity of phytase family protein [Erythrobacter sp. LQ02-29]|uniref:esterase-like activity of phytase family protein n=1 Tax=Erythrobacter sp. LQ02-29 TaxID=2920384 RepID=UPI001F4DE30C|nr:esterase-like activity of phytase family protein [Erythrobacter sp. LQ02-29]MCP9221895.1 esterase-like activity of phytase family protein [Erythrobacter sp. LQ02-29]